jgi:hypothetical protein
MTGPSGGGGESQPSEDGIQVRCVARVVRLGALQVCRFSCPIMVTFKMYCLKLTGKDWTSQEGGIITLLNGLQFASSRSKRMEFCTQITY